MQEKLNFFLTILTLIEKYGNARKFTNKLEDSFSSIGPVDKADMLVYIDSHSQEFLSMKQADMFMDFVYDSRFCFLTLYNYTVAFDREAEDCNREYASWKLCFFNEEV